MNHWGSGNENQPGGILIVDGDEGSRYVKSRILRQAGYRVAQAASGAQALRQMESEPPDLVLLDVHLPDIHGVDVCRLIKQNPETASIPVLQISAAFCDEHCKVAGLEGEADGYVFEPVEPAQLIATVRAFLRIRRAEQAVREHALEWKSTFDAISDGLALTDLHGRIVRSNHALATLLSRETEDLTGAMLDELFPFGKSQGIDWERLAPGMRQRTEAFLDGRLFSLTVDPIVEGPGRLRGAVCIISDITERRLMNERLWHKQKLESIGLLAGGVAHDFNNILVGILGNASLGIDRLSDIRFAERAFRDILRASQRAADLTRQLLAYAGKGQFVVQDVNVSQVVAAMLPLVKASVPRKIDLVMNLSDHLPGIKADKTQIEQIVMNLMINAAEAVGEKAGTVWVTTKAARFSEDQQEHYLSEGKVCGNYVALEVRDNGAGMDENTLRQIFDPFFTTKFMGRGLGLSAVMGIVRGHQGAIRVTSAPGKGATFELLFPSAAAAVEIEEEEEFEDTLNRTLGRGTILVVDDEPIVRDFFQSALERAGYEVVLAKDGSEALRIFALEPERYAGVLLDLVMPVMNGQDVLPLLLELRPELRIVVTSGQVEEEALKQLSGWKIAGFIQKPCVAQTLVEKVSSFTGTRVLARG